MQPRTAYVAIGNSFPLFFAIVSAISVDSVGPFICKK